MGSFKKLKLSTPSTAEFQRGSIVKIRLENFVIYQFTEFHLSPSLNMIIGPNGSGKSTFVCAVCLGLAGRPEFIGRAKKAQDYIRNGCNSCKITIYLKNNPEVLTEFHSLIKESDDLIEITRKIFKNEGSGNNKQKNQYFINGISVPENKVKEIINKLKIQLDNLCQFLSQERVEEFARLKNEKLLYETMRSIDPDLVDILEKLKEIEVLEQEQQQKLKNKLKRKSELNEKLEHLQQAAHALQLYKQKLEQIDLNRKLIPFVKYSDLEKAKNDAKKAMIATKEEHDALLERFEPDRERLQTLNQQLDLPMAKVNKYKKKFQEAHSMLEDFVTSIDKNQEQIKTKLKQIEYYNTRHIKQKEAIKQKTFEKHRITQERDMIETISNEEIESLLQQRKHFGTEINQLESQKLDVEREIKNYINNINKLKSDMVRLKRDQESNDTIHILNDRSVSDNVKNAVHFLRDHMDEMKGSVLEPPVMAVSSQDDIYANYLDSIVDRSTALSLTMVDASCYNKYSDVFLNKFGIGLRQLGNKKLPEPQISSQNLRSKYGFDGYLDEFLQGDPMVIQMLCEQNMINQIPVSKNALSRQMYEKLLTVSPQTGRPLFPRVIAGGTVYNFRVSNYGDRQVFSNDYNTRQTNFYKGNVISSEHIELSQRKINEKKQKVIAVEGEVKKRRQTVNEYQSNIVELKAKALECKNEYSALQAKNKRWNNLNNAIHQKSAEIERMTQNLNKDASSKIQELQNEIKEHLEDTVTLQNSKFDTLETMEKIKKRALVYLANRWEISNRLYFAKEQFSNAEQEINTLADEFNEKKEIYKNLKNNKETKAWRKQVQSYSAELNEKLKAMIAEYQEEDKFDERNINNTINILQDEISMSNHDRSAAKVLKEVELELGNLEQQIPQQEQELQNLRTKLKSGKDIFEPRASEIVSKISKRFSTLFTSVGSAGEVQLVRENSFRDWRIEILVKFRDNVPLKVLDSHTQSGGERAVSTVLYMIALQEFTTAPFRVVDEINQGMDANNERIVHKAMVENACSEKTSQYFLITPKLLTGLYYHPKMRIHCVVAGSWIPNPSKEPEKVHFGETSSYVL
ncbi:related to Structural maintenance of chromosomes protein 5 [Saccharomycodes ludwigii]|uniref:Structural maintenance of chromosomes protein 5 n=1 Tax=Saccharomycodes ludwigii TaxID=36035 RepID=A0A376B7P6_9ASCO|nr:hypothetical protein SCDLUD_000501 [Saccharomycodes ludwigii]KAH3902906.1 hypothetical protein SCDLUD_000501 [Saccharomycodes ludwigii]SSD60688.1 related to Structural maintenance of chromosomes protein 5 [Saccharomycodes ludwigii]